MRILPALLGQGDPGAAFSAVIQLGTLLAVLVYFRRDLFVDMPRALVSDRKSANGRLPLYLVAGTLPIVVLGLLLKPYIVGPWRSLYVVATALGVWGLVMIVADRRVLSRVMSSLTLTDAMLIGCAQTLALVPGVSRSGATIVMALFLGFRRTDAARFSFLLGIPAIGGAGILELKDALSALGSGGWLPLLVGTITAAVSGYATIAWLLSYLGKRTLWPFGAYRIALACVLLALCVGGILLPGAAP